jgi:hypothetical protein
MCDRQTLHTIQRRLDRILELVDGIEGDIRFELVNIHAKRQARDKLARIQRHCGWIRANAGSGYDTLPGDDLDW